MRSTLTILFSLSIISLCLAQEIFSPLTFNSEVAQAYQKKWGEFESEAHPIQHFFSSNCLDLDKELYAAGGEVFAISGNTKMFCIDRLIFNGLDSIACLNCDNLVSGTVGKLNQEDFCISYSANSGIDLDFSDTLEIEIFLSDGSEILEFPISIRRANQTILLNQILVDPDTSTNMCISNINLPGSDYSYVDLHCHDTDWGNIGYLNDSCFNYFSKRFGAVDTICIEVCDEYCVCDVYEIPIEIITPPAMNLPFFDDFSNEGPYPNSELWLDDKIWVNNTLGVDPPSIGIATFDGMNENGTPYGNNFDRADFLTSTYIDLSSNNAGQNVTLSFYLAPKGKGYPPQFDDIFEVEFKNSSDEWITVGQWNGPDNNPGLLETIGFDFYSVELDESEWFHDNFQFRFVNSCRRVGIQYIWNLDYVRLENQAVQNPPTLPDLTFTKPPSNILNTYEHIPLNQLEVIANSEFAATADLEVFNHFDSPRSVTNNFNNFVIRDKENLDTLFIDDNFIPHGVNGFVDFFPANSRYDANLSFNYSQDVPANIDFSLDHLLLESIYEFSVNEEFVNAYPASKSNNRVTRTHIFDDFYGYDDGTAEITARLSNGGATEIAMEFDLYVADSIKGFQVYFPHFGQASGTEFTVNIYKDNLDNDPVYTSNDIEVLFPDELESNIAGFTHYRFVDENGEPEPTLLSSGKYFISIKKADDGSTLYVGFDLNNTKFQNKQWFYNTSSFSWIQQFIPGAYLLRPVLGKGKAPSTNIEQLNAVLSFEVFPNPTSETLFVKTNSGEFDFHIYDLYGRTLNEGKLTATIAVDQLDNGIYYLQISNTANGTSGVQKIEILR